MFILCIQKKIYRSNLQIKIECLAKYVIEMISCDNKNKFFQSDFE